MKTRAKPLIRRATAKDVEQILAIAAAGELSEWTYQDYVKEIERGDSLFYVIEIEDAIVSGFIAGRVVPGISDSIKSAEIYNVGVDRAQQRIGLGRTLLEVFMLDARAQNASEVHLEVRSGNREAIAFYRKLGFAETGTRNAFYTNPPEDAVLMISTL